MVCLHPAAVQVSAIFSPLLEFSSGNADIGFFPDELGLVFIILLMILSMLRKSFCCHLMPSTPLFSNADLS